MLVAQIIDPDDKARLTSSAERYMPRRLPITCPHMLRGWRFSHHARKAVDARGFDPHDVIEACERPELTMTADDYEPGRMRYVRGLLVVIAVPARSEIITVLLRSLDAWNDADAREATGR